VVVTQGTAANGDLHQLVQPTLDALADTDHLIVAAFGREPRPGELNVPANARVERFIPFDRLFPFTAAVITNGGYGGTQLALAHGLPVVVAGGGGGEDKPMTAARVAAFGVGLDLLTPRPTPQAISAAIDRVLGDPSYRQRATELASHYQASEPIARIQDLLNTD
jgi:UDP:flavonoid glycosyltransferase YjiC (YdhE family)